MGLSMQSFRDDLIQRIDSLIAEYACSQPDTARRTLRIEATFISSQDNDDLDVRPLETLHQGSDRGKKFILEEIDLGEWQAMPDASQDKRGDDPESVDGHSRTRPKIFTEVQTRDELESSGIPTPPSTGVVTPAVRRGSDMDDNRGPRRKVVGGLRLATMPASPEAQFTPPRTPSPPSTRRLQSNARKFPQRKKRDEDVTPTLLPSSLDKLIEGIWDQIYKQQPFSGAAEPSTLLSPLFECLNGSVQLFPSPPPNEDSSTMSFGAISQLCHKVTTGSRVARSLEVIIQAHWVEKFDQRIQCLRDANPDARAAERRKIVIGEACKFFGWSERELRNRMAIWRGYLDIKNAAGWSALVFAGPGIYRFCKYKVGFDYEAISRLCTLKTRFEVAADTLQPRWRALLSVVGESSQRLYHGHPHDWVVSRRREPVQLRETYRQWELDFSFEHLTTSVIDPRKWTRDPRQVQMEPTFVCGVCSKPQSPSRNENECDCFADLFGPNSRPVAPVQVFSTEDGRNNGLVALCAFPRGTPVGEFVGLITSGLENVDVMQGQAGGGDDSNPPYQIWQGRQGNFTRFINHSCQPNCQFQKFTWLGIERILVVSRGVAAGKEITVDYSNKYWHCLEKQCLCGEAKCRYG